MAKNNKRGGFKVAKNYEPNRGKAAPGSRSPGHRGFRPEEPQQKNRWNADERAERAGGGRNDFRGNRSGGTHEGGKRFDDRNDRGGFRGDRSGAPQRGGDFRGNREGGFRNDRNDGGFRNDRGPRDGGFRNDRNDGGFRGNRSGGTHEGGKRFDDRNDRGGFRGDRSGAPQRGGDFRGNREGGFRNDRNDGGFRNDRGPRDGFRNDRDTRGERTANEEQAPREEFFSGHEMREQRSPRGGQAARSERMFSESGERPQRRYFDNEGQERGERFERSERPARFDRSERPARGERPERSFDRPARGERSERPARFDRSERPERGGRDGFRPERRNDRGDRGFGNDRGSRGYGADRDQAQKPRFTPVVDVVLERLVAEATVASDIEGATFETLGLGENIVRALGEMGAASPFPIQAATIPDVLSGSDVLGRGRTGSGKTIAFGAPLVERLLKLKAEGLFDGDPKQEKPERTPRGERPKPRRQAARNPKALILAPTRELALQIDRTVQPIARSVGLFTTQIYGGVPQARQVGALERGVDIIIGTPGRIEDLIEQRKLNLSEVVISVLDEADHMCDLGFLEPVQRILRRTKNNGQKLLFSATLDQGVASLVKEFLPEPRVHEVAGEDQASGTIDHKVLIVNREDKDEILQQLADREGKTLIFSRTRAYAERMTEQLEDAGMPAVSLHGDLNQARRTRNLEKLTNGRVNILVATDVAARGIHVDDIDLVLQADPPDEYKTYLHRAGRTGRAGKEGTVVTIIPRNRQRRTQELFERAEITPSFFGEFFPGDQLR